MTAVTVSPKYQIVILKEIRESMGIVSGQKVQIMSHQGRIEVISSCRIFWANRKNI
jgi:AbrB family looped-hinge helix DNA binding protein